MTFQDIRDHVSPMEVCPNHGPEEDIRTSNYHDPEKVRIEMFVFVFIFYARDWITELWCRSILLTLKTDFNRLIKCSRDITFLIY